MKRVERALRHLTASQARDDTIAEAKTRQHRHNSLDCALMGACLHPCSSQYQPDAMTADLNPKLDFVPDEVFLVNDLETLKVLADPLRLSIRELMIEPTTVKQVAARLEMPPTKLYYHINLLEKHHLIVLVDPHLEAGIAEKHYQVAAYSVRVAKHLLSPNQDDAGDGLSLTVHSLFDSARDNLLQAVRDGVVELDDEGERHRGLSLHVGRLGLTDAQAAAFYAELEALVKRFQELSEQQIKRTDTRLYRAFYALHPGKDTRRDET